MSWQIGIDEAGYGPNLGPFVMTLVACRGERSDLWAQLKSGVRRFDEPADHRLIVADSKQVYAPARGWCDLERTVLAAQPWQADDEPVGTFRELLQRLCGEGEAPAEPEAPQASSTNHDPLGFTARQEPRPPIGNAILNHLHNESWFVGDTIVPTETDVTELASSRRLWQDAAAAADVSWGYCRSAIVPAPRFNDLIDQWDSKSAVLSVAVTDLMRRCVATLPPGPMQFVIDKHGGRDKYSALLQHAFPDGIVLAEEEGRSRSVYRVEGLDRPVRILVMPKADVEHFTVALASMVSKYVRELLMREFNRFWLGHVPGLEPTAGYPNDAVRFIQAIRPAMKKLGIAERLVWRSR